MIIAVIPAQDTSRRLPGKNMKHILGRPMLEWTISYVRACSLIQHIYVSTNSDQISNYAKSLGVEPVLRPEELCGEVPIVEVLKNVIKNIPSAATISHVVALQVDHPDRHIDLTSFVEQALKKNVVDAITIDPDGYRNGSIRMVSKEALMNDRLSYSIMAIEDPCTNIHFQKDLERAELNLRKIYKVT